MIFIEKNFISKQKCQDLISLYEENNKISYQHRDTFPINTEKFLNITDRIETICFEFNNSIRLDTHQIVKWPQGSFMDPHKDPQNDVFAAIVYLNDDYVGGETGIENMTIKPEVGKLVIFSNNQLMHWVNKIEKGTRYTLAMWFINS